MTIKLDNEDFILGVLAARESDELEVEWIATGSYGTVGLDWHLVTFHGESVLVLRDSERGSASCSGEFEFTDKKDLTERLIQTIRSSVGNDLESAVAVIFGESADANVNSKFVDKETFLRVVQSGMARLNCKLDAEAWAKQLGFS